MNGFGARIKVKIHRCGKCLKKNYMIWSAIISSTSFLILRKEKTIYDWESQEGAEVGDKLQRISKILPVNVKSFRVEGIAVEKWKERNRSRKAEVKVIRARQWFMFRNKVTYSLKREISQGKKVSFTLNLQITIFIRHSSRHGHCLVQSQDWNETH